MLTLMILAVFFINRVPSDAKLLMIILTISASIARRIRAVGAEIELECDAEVPTIDEAGFHAQATAAKEGCPVSKALKAVEITLKARKV